MQYTGYRLNNFHLFRFMKYSRDTKDLFYF